MESRFISLHEYLRVETVFLSGNCWVLILEISTVLRAVLIPRKRNGRSAACRLQRFVGTLDYSLTPSRPARRKTYSNNMHVPMSSARRVRRGLLAVRRNFLNGGRGSFISCKPHNSRATGAQSLINIFFARRPMTRDSTPTPAPRNITDRPATHSG